MSPNLARSPTLSVVAAVLLATAGLAGCLSQDASASTGEVYVKDALTDEVDAVHVEFTRAEVLPADSQAWESVYEGEKEIELLSLSDSAAKEQLADFEIEPGEYDRLRLRISNVTVEHPNGTSEELVVYGNMVTVAENLSYEPGEDLKVLLDFDLEKGVNVTAGEYVPVVRDLQRSDEDADGDGVSDFNATDDDGDGIPDAQDEDRDGDGQPDVPKQAQAFDKRGLNGLCVAYENNEQGREQGNVTENGTAFHWLEQQASEAGQSVDAYCEEQTSPGAPDTVAQVTPEDLPEKAQEAIGDRHIGPDDRRGQAGEDRREDRDQADQRREQDRSGDENRTAEDRDGDQQEANQTQGNETRDGNQTADDPDGNESDTDDSQADGNGTADEQP